MSRLSVGRVMQAARRRLVRGDPVAQRPPPAPAAVEAVEPVAPLRPVLELMAAAPPVTVVIPVYNAPDAVEACLASVVRNTGTADRVLVIDDASTDPRVTEVLSRYSSESVAIVTNGDNLGFTGTANRGFAESFGDVVLLNSDTEVPPRWVERLRMAAYSDPTIATVTPLTNGAGAFSAPSMPGPNSLPAGTHVDVIGREVARSGALVTVDTPTASGFCMYIKRAALDDIGDFDLANFPRGYGEENDFSMRASAAGWRHVVDASTYVLHARAASFGAEREALSRHGAETMNRLHPDYQRQVDAFVSSPAMEDARRSAGEAFTVTPARGGGRPRVLYVLHDFGGGTPLTTRDLAEGISDRWEPLVLRSGGDRLTLSAIDGETLASRRLVEPVRFGPSGNPEYAEAVTELLLRHDIELVHIRHLLKHSLDLPSVADALNIPTVLSFHDFYYVCPTAHLLDNTDRFCAGVCTPGQGTCRSSPWVSAGPHLKHGWVYVWRRQVEEMFSHVDAFVWTSEWARSLYDSSFPNLIDGSGHVIEHGRSLDRSGGSVARPPKGGKPIRVAVLGHVGIHKGADLLRDAADHAVGTIEFHIVGTLEGPAAPGIVVHGAYEREDLPRLLREIAPSYVLLSSITGETYSHTLTEAWASGIPVIANKLGAPVDRIRAQGGGWVAPLDTGAEIVAHINAISPDSWERAVHESLRASWPSLATMAERYADLYESVRIGRRTESRV